MMIASETLRVGQQFFAKNGDILTVLDVAVSPKSVCVTAKNVFGEVGKVVFQRSKNVEVF